MTINDNMFMEPNLLTLADYSPAWTATAWPDDDTSQEDVVDVSTSRANKRTLAPNLTRRSHKKSRAGCFSCKSRKIKCGEEKPICKNCALKLSECVYPSRQPKRDSVATTRRPSTLLTSCPFSPQFSMTDMLFFHHFLTLAYPHLPLGNDDVWLRDIPQFAQQHTYLMHAILALGASHLDRLSPVSGTHERDALMHRGHAIEGLNKALAQSEHTEYGEADAMLATCYALTFQSTYMTDGLQDFITFVRGCALATGKIQSENAPTAFNLAPNQHIKIMEERFRDMPTLNPSVINSGREAIEQLHPYVHNEAETVLYRVLHDIFTALQRSSGEGYLKFVEMYSVWYDMAHESFKAYLDSTNTTIQLLLGFFIGVQMVMVPMTQHEWTDRSSAAASSQMITSMRDWLNGVESRVPPELRYHLAWSRRMVDIVVAQIEGLPFDGPPILYAHTDSTMVEDSLQ